MNSWPTVGRMHAGGDRACVFGCDISPDSLGDYLRCPIATAILANDAICVSEMAHGPRAALGLGSVERTRRGVAAMRTMALYTAYCAVRANGRGDVADARAQLCAAARVVRLRVAGAIFDTPSANRRRRRR